MRRIAQVISWLSLVVLVVPSLLFMAGTMELDTVKKVMIAATVFWFVSACMWMWKEK